MKKGFIIYLCLLFPLLASAESEPSENVVIEELTEYVRLIPDKSGTGIKEIKNSTQYIFRANRNADKALAMAYYDDYISINKASGGNVTYSSFIGDEFFSDSKACFVTASLPKKGATAKVSVKRTYKKPEFMGKLLIYQIYDIEKAVVKIEIPECLSHRYRLEPRNMPEGKYTVAEERHGDKRIVTYTLTNLKKNKRFADAPSINVTAPQILLLGHFADTDDLYRYLLDYIPTNDPGALTVTAKAKEITSECHTDAEKIKAVNDFVHATIRYLAVEHGEFGHRPDLASEVLRKRFGDCKGSALLTRNMLRSLGIDARLVWIGTPDVGTDWSTVPNVSSGNHMITAVMLPSDSIIFLDGTARYSSHDNAPAELAGREAMIEDTPDHCIIRRLPPCPPHRNVRSEHITLTVDDDRLLAKSTQCYSGTFNNFIRQRADEYPPGLRQEFYERTFCSAMPGSKPEKIIYTNAVDSTLLSGTATIHAAIKNAGSTSYVDLAIATRIENLKFDMTNRVSDGVIGFPAILRCTVSLEVPHDMSLGDLPPDCEIENDWLTGAVTGSTADDRHSITRSLVIAIKKSVVPNNMMEEYNADLARLIDACSSNIVLKTL